MQRWFDNNRIAAISDGVFAIAMTLLVLGLKLPEIESPVSSVVFRSAIIHQLPKFVSWIISFAILCRLWSVHYALLKLDKKKTEVFTVMNFIFLGAVSFIPFPTSLISEHPDQFLSVSVFTLTILVAWGAMIGMRRCQLLTDSSELDSNMILVYTKPIITLTPIIAVVSFLLTLLKPQLGAWVWIVLPVTGRWVKHRAIRN